MLARFGPPLLASVALALVSTLGDFVWARLELEHKAVFGLAHGALLGAALGLALGLVRGRARAGLVAGAAIVLGAALCFYALVPLLGYQAMFVAWMALWLAFGLLGGRWLGPRHSAREALARGALAACGSGVAFYLVSGIWSRFDPRTIDYASNFASWTLAFLPGFLALLLERPARHA